MRARNFSLGMLESGRYGLSRRLHALCAGGKLGVFFLLCLIPPFLLRLPAGWAAALSGLYLLAALCLTLWAGFSIRTAMRWMLPGVWVGAALSLVEGASLLLFPPSSEAIGTQERWFLAAARALGVIGVVLLARLFISTTRPTDLVDSLTRGLEPLRRFGAKPETFALCVCLVLRSIPLLGSHIETILNAHRARGLKPTARSLMTPVTMSTVATTVTMSEALCARMLPDESQKAVKNEKAQ